MTRAHAVLSASGASRWIACPPSARLEERFPDSTSEYAREGTFAHQLAEIELRKALGESARRPRGYAESEYWSEDMDEYLSRYVGLVMERINTHRSHTPDAQVLLEQRLDFSRWVPNGFGTGDVVIVSDLGVEVIDLKYGRGVPVSAEGNPQLQLYGLGAYDTYSVLYDLPSVTLTIIQPRLDSITTETLAVDELLAWADSVVRPAAELADRGEGAYCAGEHCRWCRAKAVCRARAEANLELAKHEFAPPPTLSYEEIAEILRQADALQAWAKDVQGYALEQALAGVRFDGWKLVEGRSVRKYADEDAVASALQLEGYTEEQMFEKVLLGITKMEKLLGRKQFGELLDGLVVKPPGKPTLVPESDRRPELNSIAEAQADFAEEDSD